MGSKIKVEKELGCGGKCCKLLLYTFNVLFLIGGLTLLVIGLWVAVSGPSREIAAIVETNLYKAAAYVLFIAGTSVAVVAFIGCCGAKFENRCLLGTFFVFLLVIFVLELIAGIIALACYTQAEQFVQGNMKDSLTMHYGSKEPGRGNITNGWNYVQKKFECCGVNNRTEAITLYMETPWYKSLDTPPRVPESCCVTNDKGDPTGLEECQRGKDEGSMNFINEMGCYQMVRDKVIQYATVLAGVGVAVCVIQIFGMIFACCLVRQLI